MTAARRVKVYDAEDVARNYRETFMARPVEWEETFRFNWPRRLQNVGDSLAVAYASDKWRDDKVLVEFKHLAESRNRVLCVPGFLRDFDDPSRPWPAIGPMVDMAEVPMPHHFAILAPFEELNLCLHVSGTNARPRFGKHKDDGVVKVMIAHAMVGASKMRWSEHGGDDEPFLCIYTPKHGVLAIIVGEELDVLSDGITG